MTILYRKAKEKDIEYIWLILQQAIQKRKKENSTQWQSGYPNPDVIMNDIANNWGWVAMNDKHEIIAYWALSFDGEPTYNIIDGAWLNNDNYAVIHRLAVRQEPHMKGLATRILKINEQISKNHNVHNIRVDTMHDNEGMLHIFKKLEYIYTGIIQVSDGDRMAFQKVL